MKRITLITTLVVVFLIFTGSNSAFASGTEAPLPAETPIAKTSQASQAQAALKALTSKAKGKCRKTSKKKWNRKKKRYVRVVKCRAVKVTVAQYDTIVDGVTEGKDELGALVTSRQDARNSFLAAWLEARSTELKSPVNASFDQRIQTVKNSESEAVKAINAGVEQVLADKKKKAINNRIAKCKKTYKKASQKARLKKCTDNARKNPVDQSKDRAKLETTARDQMAHIQNSIDDQVNQLEDERSASLSAIDRQLARDEELNDRVLERLSAADQRYYDRYVTSVDRWLPKLKIKK